MGMFSLDKNTRQAYSKMDREDKLKIKLYTL